MLGKKLVLEDLEDFDPQVFKSLEYMLQKDAEMLCQVFVHSQKFFDQDIDIELKPGGKEIDVTNENKFEYCHLVLKYKLYECIKDQINNLL